MNAIEQTPWSEGWRKLATSIVRPHAVLAISAHWFIPGSLLTSSPKPETIHDFGGFPQELFDCQYSAPGEPELALRAAALLGGGESNLTDKWGLDHGTWSILLQMYPEADIPVIQLSVDYRQPPTFHLRLGELLRPLREEGVLILGSGNITHNLRDAFARMQSGERSTPPWAETFDKEVVAAVERRNGAALIALPDTKLGKQAQPTIDHYLPLLYAFGASDESDGISFPIVGFDVGSLSMRSIIWQ